MSQRAFRLHPLRPAGYDGVPSRFTGRGRRTALPVVDSDPYRVLFEHAPDGYLTTDTQGRIRQANRVAHTLLHVRRGALEGRPLALFVSPGERKVFRSRLKDLHGSARSGIEEWQIRAQPAGAEPFDAALAVARVAAGSRFFFVWALRDIRNRTRIERKLKESEQRHLALYRQMLAHRDELRILAARSLHAREEEARRIARELHDEAGQMTASVHLALAEIARELPAAAGRFESVRALLDELEQRLRRLSHELRPTILDDLGLRPALEFLAEGFSARSGIALSVEGSTEGRLDPLVETSVYRIVQEALTNISRHSRATRGSIRISRDREELRCSIRDDGVGIGQDPFAPRRSSRRGIGLLGIRERLDALRGTLRIRSRPGRGTELLVGIPIRSAG